MITVAGLLSKTSAETAAADGSSSGEGTFGKLRHLGSGSGRACRSESAFKQECSEWRVNQSVTGEGGGAGDSPGGFQ